MQAVNRTRPFSTQLLVLRRRRRLLGPRPPRAAKELFTNHIRRPPDHLDIGTRARTHKHTRAHRLISPRTRSIYSTHSMTDKLTNRSVNIDGEETGKKSFTDHPPAPLFVNFIVDINQPSSYAKSNKNRRQPSSTLRTKLFNKTQSTWGWKRVN